ncbi:hypothetical protein MGF_2844 [Mycoplasmoides gallisepticum str. F]|uniref:Uncharacterized protein n=1 Tax=Mycoplasmoides gallisepticum S6 TaxID=1006581 RepID=A0A0F6CKU5_MYCGL|nr:hypothetical protein [Mycoplasmoides gallisepticum]ADC31316.1 hypothetical protein MGF_2844 [Mycoplasmoides gallisepticum str. F]AHB99717.1 hypothetical protein GCW_02570 [Mycoplasmoides gallisepticum S6]
MNFKLTHHSRIRAVQRLVLQEKNELFIDHEINEILRDLIPYYVDKKNFAYFEIPKKFLIDRHKRTYAIVDQNNGIITSITPISPSKFIKIYSMN